MNLFSKLWFQQNINKIGTERASELIRNNGFSLPCHVTSISGQLVTVAFDVSSTIWSLPEITIPKAEGPWNFSPTQVGDFGVTMSADVYLGGISGQGGGIADFSECDNLGSTLVWVPVGNKAFSPLDQNAGLSQGPNGWTLQTSDGNSSVSVGTSGVTLKFGSKVVTLDSTGLTIDGILFDTHFHADPQGGDTGPPL